MMEDKDRPAAQADNQPAVSKAASDRPEADEFYSEIPDSDEILTRSVEEVDIGPVDGRANSKAFEEEMDDL